MDAAGVKRIEPPLLERAPAAFDLGLGGAIPYTGMDEDCPDIAADQAELLVRVAAAVVDVKFLRDAVCGNRVLEHLLEICGIVAVEQLAADEHPGMVVDDHDGVDAARLAVFNDVREIAGVGLPHSAECRLFKGFAVPHIGISRGLEVIAAYEPLDGADIDRGRDEAIPDKRPVNLCGVKARELLFEAENFLNCRVRQRSGSAFVRPRLRHQRIYSSLPVALTPSFQGFVLIGHRSSIRKGKRLFCDSLKVCLPADVRIEILDDRSDKGEPELRDLHRRIQFSVGYIEVIHVFSSLDFCLREEKGLAQTRLCGTAKKFLQDVPNRPQFAAGLRCPCRNERPARL